MIQLKDDEREILRSTFYQAATELKENHPDASTNEIRTLLKDIIDISV